MKWVPGPTPAPVLMGSPCPSRSANSVKTHTPNEGRAKRHLAVCFATGAATTKLAAARSLFRGAGRAAPASAASPAAIVRTARVNPAPPLAPPPLALALWGTAIVATRAAPQTNARLRRPLRSGTLGEGAVATHCANASSASDTLDEEESAPDAGTDLAAAVMSS